MNYEERYNQALERAKKVHDGKLTISPNEVNDFNVYEYIFPELCESEDERIRKAIVKMISDIDGGFPFEKYGIIKKKALAWLEKQGELKLIDESESKFEVGDWITNGEYTWKVTDIKPLNYVLQSQNGDTVDDTISYVDEQFHLWTIQDAKDGDILSDEKPFIFRGFGDSEHPNNPTAYCGINSSGTFILSTENEWWTADDFYPATKEQRDLLFQKMKEAGYEWDAEKKELKNIEQTSAWSKEDEERIGFLIAMCDDEQAECVNNSTVYRECTETKDWLKSIKPNHWKPSEEQMEALDKAKNSPANYYTTILELQSLYNDLKKL